MSRLDLPNGLVAEQAASPRLLPLGKRMPPVGGGKEAAAGGTEAAAGEATVAAAVGGGAVVGGERLAQRGAVAVRVL